MMNDYTLLDGERRFKQIDWGPAPLPPCQAHLMVGSTTACEHPGEFDCPTPDGPWADLCKDHATTLSRADSSLGYHRIQVRLTDG